MTPAETVRRLYVAFRDGDLATVEQIFSPDVIFHGTDGHRFGGTVRGRDAFFAVWAELGAAVSAFETETMAIAGDDEVAFGHNLITVTRLDGSQVQFHNVTSFRFDDAGRISEAFEATTADWASVLGE